MANRSPPVLVSAVRTAWPATRPAHSFLKFRAHPLNVLPSGFRFFDGDNPADPLIPREWRNVLPFCSRRRVRNENFLQIRWYSVYGATRDRCLRHRFQSISNRPKKTETAVLTSASSREAIVFVNPRLCCETPGPKLASSSLAVQQ